MKESETSSVLNPAGMDVLILCGGLGKRLRSVISDRPKPMAEIVHRSFLNILIVHTSKYGFRRFILCVGYMKEVIKEYYRGQKGIIFSEERESLGTGGALKNAESSNQNVFFKRLELEDSFYYQVGSQEYLRKAKGLSVNDDNQDHLLEPTLYTRAYQRR